MDTCLEICGDGLNKEFWECDDGNLIDGDGCSSVCTVEHGWQCLSGDPSYCYKHLRPWIINYGISDDSSLIFLEFNTSVHFRNTWVQDRSWSLKFEGPLDEYHYKWEVVNQTEHINVTSTILYVHIDYPDQLFGYDFENITLYFNDSTQLIDATNGFEMVDKAVQFFLKGKERHTPIGYWVGILFFLA